VIREKDRRLPDMIAQGPHEACPTGFASAKEPPNGATHSTGTLYVAQCDVGRGVFAQRAIRRGEFILAFGGPLIDFAETKRRGVWECMAIQMGPNQYTDAQAPGVLVNHSCAPNAGIRNDRNLVALRDILPGEEIRYDYSTTMDEKSFTMSCRCGAPGCRRVVKDFSELPADVQEYYVRGGLVMNFIVRRLRGAKAGWTRGAANAGHWFEQAAKRPAIAECR
jgi:hypothetical protein